MRESEAMERPTRRQRPGWRVVAPALLLLAVASHQIVRAYTTDLDPWKGGGFGMFSSADGTPIRHTHLYLTFSTKPELELSDDLGEELEDEESRIRTLPSDGALRSFAEALSDAALAEHPDHRGVRVELWKNQYDRETLEVRTEILRVIEIEVDDRSAP